MVSHFFNYSAILGRAMQRVVHNVLSYVAENGLPGGHHFYITFSTHADGVILPNRVLKKYPEQITIVLQHEFYNLKVDEHGFDVELVFDGARENIRTTFDSLVEFSDPHSSFSMQFDLSEWRGISHDEDDGDDDEADYDGDECMLRDTITERITAGLLGAVKSNDDVDGSARDKKGSNVVFIDDYLNNDS